MAVNDRKPDAGANRRGILPGPLKKFLAKRNIIGLYHHCRLARFLTAAGFDIRRIERQDNLADVWVVQLRRGFVPSGEEVETAKAYVHTFLLRQGVRYPKREIDVSVRGERLIVAFIWKAGTPGMLIFGEATCA